MFSEELQLLKYNRNKEIIQKWEDCPEERRKHFKKELSTEFRLAPQTIGLIIRRSTGIKQIEFRDDEGDLRLKNGLIVKKCIFGYIMAGE